MKGINGFAQAILAATPLAAIILYFTLSGQQQVRTDQQKMEVTKEIATERFDLEFDALNQELSGTPMTEKEKAERLEKIDELETKKEKWDQKFDAEFEKTEADLKELRKALAEDEE